MRYPKSSPGWLCLADTAPGGISIIVVTPSSAVPGMLWRCSSFHFAAGCPAPHSAIIARMAAPEISMLRVVMFKLLTATVQDECSCSIRSAWKCSSRLVRYDNCVELGPDVALIAGLIGEPARAAMLVALVNGRALAAGELAFIGNVAPQTASFHLRKLMDASLLVVEKHGKHSYYRLANEQVATTLESIAALAPLRKVADLRARAQSQSARFNELRFARSCYRHLAGMLAVEINQALLHRALLIADSETTYCLTDLGLEWCRQLVMSIPKPAL